MMVHREMQIYYGKSRNNGGAVPALTWEGVGLILAYVINRLDTTTVELQLQNSRILARSRIKFDGGKRRLVAASDKRVDLVPYNPTQPSKACGELSRVGEGRVGVIQLLEGIFGKQHHVVSCQEMEWRRWIS